MVANIDADKKTVSLQILDEDYLTYKGSTGYLKSGADYSWSVFWDSAQSIFYLAGRTYYVTLFYSGSEKWYVVDAYWRHAMAFRTVNV